MATDPYGAFSQSSIQPGVLTGPTQSLQQPKTQGEMLHTQAETVKAQADAELAKSHTRAVDLQVADRSRQEAAAKAQLLNQRQFSRSTVNSIDELIFKATNLANANTAGAWSLAADVPGGPQAAMKSILTELSSKVPGLVSSTRAVGGKEQVGNAGFPRALGEAKMLQASLGNPKQSLSSDDLTDALLRLKHAAHEDYADVNGADINDPAVRQAYKIDTPLSAPDKLGLPLPQTVVLGGSTRPATRDDYPKPVLSALENLAASANRLGTPGGPSNMDDILSDYVTSLKGTPYEDFIQPAYVHDIATQLQENVSYKHSPNADPRFKITWQPTGEVPVSKQQAAKQEVPAAIEAFTSGAFGAAAPWLSAAGQQLAGQVPPDSSFMDQVQANRATQAALERQNPGGLFTAGSLIGDVAAQEIGSRVPGISAITNPVARQAVVGGVQGGLSGAEQSSTLPEAFGRGALGAAVGAGSAATGAALPGIAGQVIAAPVSDAAKLLANKGFALSPLQLSGNAALSRYLSKVPGLGGGLADINAEAGDSFAHATADKVAKQYGVEIAPGSADNLAKQLGEAKNIAYADALKDANVGAGDTLDAYRDSFGKVLQKLKNEGVPQDTKNAITSALSDTLKLKKNGLADLDATPSALTGENLQDIMRVVTEAGSDAAGKPGAFSSVAPHINELSDLTANLLDAAKPGAAADLRAVNSAYGDHMAWVAGKENSGGSAVTPEGLRKAAYDSAVQRYGTTAASNSENLPFWPEIDAYQATFGNTAEKPSLASIAPYAAAAIPYAAEAYHAATANPEDADTAAGLRHAAELASVGSIIGGRAALSRPVMDLYQKYAMSGPQTETETAIGDLLSNYVAPAAAGAARSGIQGPGVAGTPTQLHYRHQWESSLPEVNSKDYPALDIGTIAMAPGAVDTSSMPAQPTS